MQELSSEKQIILSTHSPFFYKNCFKQPNIELLVTRSDEYKCKIDNSSISLRTFPWSPSWGEINYFAYNLATIEFHNELYGYLQEKNSLYRQQEIENYLSSHGLKKSKKWIRVNNDSTLKDEMVSLPTYIRNTIHHPENTNNSQCTFEEIKGSIGLMLNLLQ